MFLRSPASVVPRLPHPSRIYIQLHSALKYTVITISGTTYISVGWLCIQMNFSEGLGSTDANFLLCNTTFIFFNGNPNFFLNIRIE